MPFIYKELPIPGLLIIEPVKYRDERGFFMEKYKFSDFKLCNIPEFVQDNFSFSDKNVIRGLHYQVEPHAQGKLVSVVKGRVWDVAVDIRKKSPFFGKWFGVELNEDNNLSFYIPPGFAHGFSVLSKGASLLYKCTNEYNQSSERGIIWNDSDLAIDWKIVYPKLSPKDIKWPKLKDIGVL